MTKRPHAVKRRVIVVSNPSVCVRLDDEQNIIERTLYTVDRSTDVGKNCTKLRPSNSAVVMIANIATFGSFIAIISPCRRLQREFRSVG
jgi:hypothetical protein